MAAYTNIANRLIRALALSVCLAAPGLAAVQEKTVIFFPGPPFAEGSLAVDAAGNVYGALQAIDKKSGNFTNIIYKLSQPGGQTTHAIFTGLGPDFARPSLVDAAGNLYGITVFAFVDVKECGRVFKLSPTAHGPWTETSLHSFPCGTVPGAATLNSLVISDSKGNLYGVADGVNNRFIYELARGANNQWAYSVIFTCQPTQCGEVLGGFDAQGNLYGAGESVFKLTPNSTGTWSYTSLHVFPPFTAATALFLDSQGKLFGANPDTDTAFSLTPNGAGGWRFKTIWNFPAGSRPAGISAVAPARLVGTTENGGDSGAGSVFALDQVNGKWHEAVVHSFRGISTDGANPHALVASPNGTLFGVAGGGTANCSSGGCGMLFEVIP